MLLLDIAVAIFSVAMMLGTNVVSAQDYPNKPIRIVTAAAGSGSDFDARIVAQGISGPLGQPVIVDNRGSGALAAEIVSIAPADGYTLLASGGNVWIFPLLQKASYDVLRDFAPISLIERSVLVVTVHPSVPANTVKELIALAKAKPGVLNYASTAAGGTIHLAVELFNHMAGINVVRVAYKGNAPAITALVSGEVQMTIIDAGGVAPFVKSGQLRALAVTSLDPSVLAPGLPTVASSGLPGYQAIGLTGMFAPAKTPAPIITRITQELVRFLSRTEVKERFLAAGVETIGSSPEQFTAIMKADMVNMGNVIKEAGIKID